MSRCLVIGAGVMGLCQAHSLALRHQVVLMPSPYDQINVQDGAIQSPFGAIDSSVSLFDSDHSTDFDFVFCCNECVWSPVGSRNSHPSCFRS